MSEKKQSVVGDIISVLSKNKCTVAEAKWILNAAGNAILEQNNHIKRAKMLEEMSKKYAGRTFEQVLDAHATKELCGDFLVPLPETGRKTYSAQEVGERFGISAKAVGRISNANNLKTAEYGSWFVDKSPYGPKEVSTFRYFDTVFPQIEKALQEKGAN